MINKKVKNLLNLPIFKIISEVSQEMNLKSFVIGGAVRDYFLEKNYPKDIDIVTIGSGIELAKNVANKIPNSPPIKRFKKFGTAMLRFGEYEIEFVGARKESYRSDSRKPIVEDGSLQDDQNRRDFTINILALSLNTENFGELLDPFGGIKDLQNKIIKTPLDPDKTYSDDPLRMMRAIRFVSQLNFHIEKNSLRSIEKNSDRLKIISQERIIVEFNKIMMSEKPSIGLKLLFETKLLHIILHELTDLQGVEDINGQKHKDNFYHTLQVVDNISKTTQNLWLRWAALLHDIGKAPTKKFDTKIGWTFHNHEYWGAKRMIPKIFKRLKLPLQQTLKYVQKIVLLSSRPIVLAEDIATDSAVRRLLFDAGNDIEDLMLLCEADITTRNENKLKQYKNNFKLVRQKLKKVEKRDKVKNWQPPISGKLIMQTFDLKPCKEVGKIKNAIKNAILDGHIPNKYDAAFELMIIKGNELNLQRKI